VRGAPTLGGTVVLNVVLIYSVFVFAIVLGAGIEEVKGRLAAVRSGEVGLRLQRHVLVLNWSPLAVPLLRQLAAARADPASPLHKRPVVLLADVPKPALDAQLAEAMKGLKIELYTRSGQPWRLGDLHRVCAPDAACIILLEPCAAGAGGGSSGGTGSSSGGTIGAAVQQQLRADQGAAAPAPHLKAGGAAAAAAAAADGGGADRRQQALKAAALMGLLTVLEGGSSGEAQQPATTHPAAAGEQACSISSLVFRRLNRQQHSKQQQRRQLTGGDASPSKGNVTPDAPPMHPNASRRGPRVIVQVPMQGANDYAYLVQRSAYLGGARGVDITLAKSGLNESSLLDR